MEDLIQVLAKSNIVLLAISILVLVLITEIVFVRIHMFKITAYCGCSVCCGKNSKGKTATGKILRFGICAVDPKVIPLHSLVFIKGLGIFRAEDVGGKIKGRHIDIYTPDHQGALNWGVRYMEISWQKQEKK